MKNIKLNGYNNLPLNVYLYDKVKKPKASILIIHGMQEHAGRYDHFAKFLESEGFIVLASDLRGHGRTANSPEDFGKGQSDDIFSEIVEDQKILAKYLENNYKCPLYIFGHSYGSFITQKMIQIYPTIKKAVICGTTNGDSTLIDLGRGLSKILMGLGSKDKRANIVEGMSLKSYGKGFEDDNWLTRDTEVWETYKKDPLCGNTFPVSFYNSMLSNLNKLNTNIKYINKDISLFLICGSKDPVGSDGKQVKSLYDEYIKNGINATLKIYPECRHELLNEINKNDIFNDILDFYD